MCYGESDLAGHQVTLPFDNFFSEAVKFLTYVTGFVIKDMNLLKLLIESFYQVAQTEFEKINSSGAKD